MRVVVREENGMEVAEFVTDGFVPDPGEIVETSGQGPGKRFRISARGVRINFASTSASYAFLVVRQEG
jgi:hypothetical protein